MRMSTLLLVPVLLASLGCGGAQEKGCGEHEAGTEAGAFKEIEPTGLHDKLQGAVQITVLDVNKPERFAQGHVPGARNVAKDAITAEILPPNKSAWIVFYCGGPGCQASRIAAGSAAALGYTNIWVMPQGIKGWEAAGLPVEKAEPTPEAPPRS